MNGNTTAPNNPTNHKISWRHSPSNYTLHPSLQSSKQSSSPWSLTHIWLWETSLRGPHTRNTLAQFGAILELMFAFGLPMHKHKLWMMVVWRKSYKNGYKYLIINIHFPVVAGKHLGHQKCQELCWWEQKAIEAPIGIALFLTTLLESATRIYCEAQTRFSP